MRLNTLPHPVALTHEGAPAKRLAPMAMLRRSVCSAMLWEKEFYEDGQEIADRVKGLGYQVSMLELAELAIEVREVHKLRHMPLLLLSVLASRGSGHAIVSDAISRVIKRPDEMGELLVTFADLNGVKPSELKTVFPAQMKKGLATALTKFDAYQLAKYNREVPVTIKDVLRLVHPRPRDEAQSALWKSLLEDRLEPPDTWEVALSGGADKRETFERLLRENKLGYLALLRNLRGMTQVDVDLDLVKQAILARRGASNVLPFRYVAASRACPQLEPELDQALMAAVKELEPLSGRTIVLVDVSGSMRAPLSRKSDMERMDAAGALASIVNGNLRVFSFSENTVEVPHRTGMAGVEAVVTSQPHFGTYLGDAVGTVNQLPHDRLIVITDEQSHDPVPDPVAERAYMINVASSRNGVGYGRWTHVDGFSENVLRFIYEYEKEFISA